METTKSSLLQFSGKIDRLALAALDKLDEVSVQAANWRRALSNDYVRDFWQRSVLFLDILRPTRQPAQGVRC